jgi:YHS domain-containing protein
MEGNPAAPGGPSMSKPTWPNAVRAFGHVGFLLLTAAKQRQPATTPFLFGRNFHMESNNSLAGRLDAEFAATRARISGQQAESVRVSDATHIRSDAFALLRERVNELASPRLKQLQDRLPAAAMTSAPSPQGDSVSFRLTWDLAVMTVDFSLSHDGSFVNAILDYNLDIVPVFIAFDRRSRLEIPLDPVACDYDRIAQWLDDRIVDFVHTYMAMQFTTPYQGDNMAIDPVAHVSFPKAFAVSSMEYGGKTFHFLSEQTHREFEQGPAAFAS